ncbi:hypothetical protein AAVH_06668 [Aphelenchoides avenae]|nr:hypothetical protein AAVH_06668 [Aphelenchus avenae]
MTTMEAWRQAFKEINGRPPSKKDMDLAPSSLRSQVELRRSPRKKRKFDLILKPSTSDDTESPKRRKKEENEPCGSDSQAALSLQRLPSADMFLSPTKDWKNLVSGNSPLATVNNLLLSPSPRKPVGVRLVSRNIQFLIASPAKPSEDDAEAKEKMEPFADEKPEGLVEKKPRKKSVFRRKNTSDNFVRINLRKKTYAPKSKNKFKKKWHKHKFNKYNKFK